MSVGEEGVWRDEHSQISPIRITPPPTAVQLLDLGRRGGNASGFDITSERTNAGEVQETRRDRYDKKRASRTDTSSSLHSTLLRKLPHYIVEK